MKRQLFTELKKPLKQILWQVVYWVLGLLCVMLVTQQVPDALARFIYGTHYSFTYQKTIN